MHAAPGVGLAASQVGVEKRVAVIDLSVGEDPDQVMVLVNPVIVGDEGQEVESEGCLSIPDFTEKVDRPARVEVVAPGRDRRAAALRRRGLAGARHLPRDRPPRRRALRRPPARAAARARQARAQEAGQGAGAAGVGRRGARPPRAESRRCWRWPAFAPRLRGGGGGWRRRRRADRADAPVPTPTPTPTPTDTRRASPSRRLERARHRAGAGRGHQRDLADRRACGRRR